MTWTKIQSNANSTSGTSSFSTSFGSAVTSGNVVVGSFFVNVFSSSGSINSISITDDKSNTYTIGVITNSAPELSVPFWGGPFTNGPTTLTVTWSDTGGNTRWLLINEFQSSVGAANFGKLVVQSVLNTNSATAYGGPVSNSATPTFGTLALSGGDALLYNYVTNTGATKTSFNSGWAGSSYSGGFICDTFKDTTATSNSDTPVTFSGSGAYTCGAVAFLFTWTHVQGSAALGTPASTTFSKAIGSGPVTSGSIVGGFIFCSHATTTLSSVTDDKGNAYSVNNANLSNGDCGLYWSTGQITNGPSTIIITLSTSDTIWFTADEMAPPLGTTSTTIEGSGAVIQTGTGTTFTSPSVSATANYDLIFSGAWGTAGITSAGTNFTLLELTASNEIATEFSTQFPSGSVQGSWNQASSANFICAAVVYKANYSVITPPSPGWGVQLQEIIRTKPYNASQQQYSANSSTVIVPVGFVFNAYPWNNLSQDVRTVAKFGSSQQQYANYYNFVPPISPIITGNAGITGLSPGIPGLAAGTLSAALIAGLAPKTPGTPTVINIGSSTIRGLGPNTPI